MHGKRADPGQTAPLAAEWCLCFHYIDGIIPFFLNPKFQASSHLLLQYNSIVSNLVGNPEDRFSRNMVQIILFVLVKKSQLPELTPPMLNKLRHLTMVSLATKTKVYSTLLFQC